MTASPLLRVVERLDHLEAVVGIDAQQFTDDKPNRATFGGGAALDTSPEPALDTSQRVVRHRCTLHPSIFEVASSFDGLRMADKPSAGHLDRSQVAERPSGALKDFLDRVVVPALKDKFLAEQKRKAS